MNRVNYTPNLVVEDMLKGCSRAHADPMRAAPTNPLGAKVQQLPAALERRSKALMDDTGGSMGPYYGELFAGSVATLVPHKQFDTGLIGDALGAAFAHVQHMGSAQAGDKTPMDRLAHALSAEPEAKLAVARYSSSVQVPPAAAVIGRDSNKNLHAGVGRSARLGGELHWCVRWRCDVHLGHVALCRPFAAAPTGHSSSCLTPHPKASHETRHWLRRGRLRPEANAQ